MSEYVNIDPEDYEPIYGIDEENATHIVCHLANSRAEYGSLYFGGGMSQSNFERLTEDFPDDVMVTANGDLMAELGTELAEAIEYIAEVYPLYDEEHYSELEFTTEMEFLSKIICTMLTLKMFRWKKFSILC